MLTSTDITIESKTELLIHIQQLTSFGKATASIIAADGELIEKFMLVEGLNVVNISHYLMKNYAIKVVNGTNITVQKI